MHECEIKHASALRQIFDLSAEQTDQSYRAGDLVEGSLVFVMPAKTDKSYWGPDEHHRARLESYRQPWQAVHAELKHNRNLQVRIEEGRGTLISDCPVVIQSAPAGPVLADLTIEGGIGHVPIVLLNAPAGAALQVQRFLAGQWVDLAGVELQAHNYYQGVAGPSRGIDFAVNVRRPSQDLKQVWRLRFLSLEQ